MEIIYRAFDGTEFDDEFDCEEYEQEKKFNAEQAALCIFADKFGKRMETPTSVQELYDTYEVSSFWFIPEEASDVIELLNRRYVVYPNDNGEISSEDDICFRTYDLDKMIELARNLNQTFPMLNQKKKKKEG